VVRETRLGEIRLILMHSSQLLGIVQTPLVRSPPNCAQDTTNEMSRPRSQYSHQKILAPGASTLPNSSLTYATLNTLRSSSQTCGPTTASLVAITVPTGHIDALGSRSPSGHLPATYRLLSLCPRYVNSIEESHIILFGTSFRQSTDHPISARTSR
jgi:hypothetical protein